MRARARALTALVAAVLAVGPAQSALAGSDADPDVQDAAGDANALAVQNAKLASPPASAAPYDILSAWFGGGTVSIRLAGPPAPTGLYIAAFNAPGCSMPPPGPPSATSAVLDDHPPSGVGLALDLKGSIGNAYYVCNVSGSTWGVTYVPYRLTGNTITFTIPAGGKLQPGAFLSNTYAMSAAGPSVLMDITPIGRNAVL